MIVLVPEHSGFCPGVKVAEKKIFAMKKKEPAQTLFIDGFLINNKNYIGYLEKNGIHTADSMDKIEEKAVVFIRTHGLDGTEEMKLREKFRVIDLTCVNVKRVQHEIERHATDGYLTIITGTKNHPEIKGLMSYAENNFFIVENETDLDALKRNGLFRGNHEAVRKIFLCSQTTGSRELFEKVRHWLVTDFAGPPAVQVEVYDSICPVTEIKEKEALKLQAEVDVSFVIGDQLSSNAKKLYRVLAAEEQDVYFVEDLSQLLSLRLPLSNYKKALVVSSASTPGFIEREITDYLKKI